MRVAALRIGGEPEQWRNLGFDVDGAAITMLGSVRIELSAAAEQGAIESWALECAEVPSTIDGLTTEARSSGRPRSCPSERRACN